MIESTSAALPSRSATPTIQALFPIRLPAPFSIFVQRHHVAGAAK